MSLSRQRKPRELTGRAVLLWLLGFFGVVFAVNAVMVNAATSTFGGVETMSSYKAGLQFKDEEAKAERQDDLHWHIDGAIARHKSGDAVLDITARDQNGKPVSGLKAVARLAHPADERRDHVIVLTRTGAGQFHGQTAAQRGQWELMIDLYRGDDRVFRSRSRVTLN